MSDCSCQDHIDVADLNKKQCRTLIIVLVINIATFLMMVFAAKISGATSLLSGALDNFGDAMTYILSLFVVGASLASKARVSMFKGLMIFGAAIVVAFAIILRILHPETPVFETMGIAALINLAANLLCLWLLTPYKDGDVNMSSAWECSRNDVSEGLAVIAAALAVWVFGSGWPDLLIAIGLLVLFLRSATRVISGAWNELHSTKM